MSAENTGRPVPPGELAGPTNPNDPARSAAATPRRKSRWGRRIAILLGLFVIVVAALIGFAPNIVSTPAVSGYLLGFANNAIAGKLNLSALSVSWGGPTEIRGIRVFDPQQREVLTVDRVTSASGLIGFIQNRLAFGEVTIDGPQATLYLNEKNEVSIAQAFALKNPTPPSTDPTRLPDMRGKITLKNGSVKASRDGGASYAVSDVNTQIDLDTLSTIGAKIQMKLADGARLTTDADLKNLVVDGVLAPLKANGKLSLQTDRAIDLASLTRLLMPASPLTGGVTLNIQAAGDANNVEATYAIDAKGIQTADRAAAKAAPLDVKLSGSATRSGDALKARADLASEAGAVKADLAYTLSDKPLDLTTDRLLSAILTGERISLPDFKLDASGGIDLVKLQKALPGILKVRQGQEITGGRLEFTALSARGGTDAATSGAIEIKDLTAVTDGKTVRVEPITLGFDASLQPGAGLQVKRAELKSSFAQVNASGAASDLKATFRASLARTKQELGQIIDLSAYDLGGELSGDLQLARPKPDRVDVTLSADTDGLRFASGSRRFDLQKMKLRQTGYLTLAQQSVTRYDASDIQADLDGQVVASASGWYDLKSSGFQAAADVKRAELGFIAARAEAIGVAALTRYAGSLTAQASAERKSANDPVQSSGALTTRGLSADGKPVLEGDAKLAWSGVQIAANLAQISAESAKLESSAANLDAKSIRFVSGDALQISADVKATAELKRLLNAVGIVAKMEKPPAVSGALALDAKVATAGGEVTFSGRGGVDNMEFGSGSQTFREKRLDLDFDGKLVSKSEQITLTRAKLASTPLSAELSGSVDKYGGPCTLALKGRYDASWEQLTALIHEFAPATAKTVVVQGKSASEFTISGPLRQPGAKPEFRGLQTELYVGWSGAQLYGVALGGAKLSPALRDGQLTIPPASIAATDGKVNLAGVVDFQPTDPTLKVAGKLQLLDRVPITPELGAQLLSYINPIFLHMARVDGRVNLQTQDVTLPFGEAIKKLAAGKGFLDLGNVKVQPGGFFAELAELAGINTREMIPIAFGKLDFVIRDGRVVYDNFAMTFPDDFDVRFRGSVGFDSTLDLVVSLPVKPALLAKLGVRGTALELARSTGGLRLDIPMVGTREQPRLDFAKVDKDQLLKQILSPQTIPDAQKSIEGILKGIGDRKEEKKKRP